MNEAVLEKKKVQTVKLKESFDKAISAVMLNFSGVSVADVTELRSQFRAAGVEYKVAKNSLLRKAFEGKDDVSPELLSTFSGMTGVAWSYEDPSSAAKIVREFRKSDPKREALEVKGGLLDGEFLDAKRVESELANLLSKDEVRAKLLSVLNAPATQLVRVLQAGPQGLVQVLKAHAEKSA